MSTSSYLPTVTLGNGSKMQSQGVGIAHPMLSISIDSVLYVPGSPFNLVFVSRLTHYLNCIISFTKDYVIQQDQTLGQMIGIGCESNGLYWLSYPSRACSLSTNPLIVHAQLGHPSLAKFQ